MASAERRLPKGTPAVPSGRGTSQRFGATFKKIVGEHNNQSAADTLGQKKLSTIYTGKTDAGVSAPVVPDSTESVSALGISTLLQDASRTSDMPSAEPVSRLIAAQGELPNVAIDSQPKEQLKSLPMGAANGSLISKYSEALGVSTAELLNAANLVQLGGSVNDINYFLTGGGAALAAANAGIDVPYDSAQGAYIKGLIEKLNNSAKAITSGPGGTNGGSFSSFFGYDENGKFVGDLPGGRPVGDLTHLDTSSGKTVVSTYKYDPASQAFRRLDTAGMTTLDVYAGPTVSMHTQTVSVASGSLESQSKS